MNQDYINELVAHILTHADSMVEAKTRAIMAETESGIIAAERQLSNARAALENEITIALRMNAKYR